MNLLCKFAIFLVPPCELLQGMGTIYCYCNSIAIVSIYWCIGIGSCRLLQYYCWKRTIQYYCNILYLCAYIGLYRCIGVILIYNYSKKITNYIFYGDGELTKKSIENKNKFHILYKGRSISMGIFHIIKFCKYLKSLNQIFNLESITRLTFFFESLSRMQISIYLHTI